MAASTLFLLCFGVPTLLLCSSLTYSLVVEHKCSHAVLVRNYEMTVFLHLSFLLTFLAGSGLTIVESESTNEKLYTYDYIVADIMHLVVLNACHCLFLRTFFIGYVIIYIYTVAIKYRVRIHV